MIKTISSRITKGKLYFKNKLVVKIDHNNIILLLTVFYFLIISSFMVYHKTWFRLDQAIIALFLAMLIFGKALEFLKDWLPFFILFISYEFLRGLSPLLNSHVNIWPMIWFDLAMFNCIPTIKLQGMFFNQGAYQWYDYVSVIFYSIHFIMPVLAGLILWFKKKKIYRQYVLAIILVSYASFITYALYPAMPPWLAAYYGFIPNVYKITQEMTTSFGHPMAIPSVYKYIGSNVNAAMPSLHAAYPFLIFLFFFKYFRKYSIIPFVYVLGVWFAVIYLGEHYVVDIIVGIIYTVFAFYFSSYIFNKYSGKAV